MGTPHYLLSYTQSLNLSPPIVNHDICLSIAMNFAHTMSLKLMPIFLSRCSPNSHHSCKRRPFSFIPWFPTGPNAFSTCFHLAHRHQFMSPNRIFLFPCIILDNIYIEHCPLFSSKPISGFSHRHLVKFDTQFSPSFDFLILYSTRRT